MTIPILRNDKVDIDYVENPEGLPFVDFIIRNQKGGIVGWASISKEQLEAIVARLNELKERL